MSVTTLRSTSQEEINKKHLVMGNKDPTIASLHDNSDISRDRSEQPGRRAPWSTEICELFQEVLF